MGQKLASDGSDPLIIAWNDVENAMQRLGDVIAASVLIHKDDGSGGPKKQASNMQSDVNYLRLSKTLVKMRQAIDTNTAFTGVFSDPAFGIILDLFVSHLIRKSVSVTDTAISGNIPPTTALRWLAVLEGRGFIERRRDITDNRRSFISLTPNGLEQVQNLLDQVHSKMRI